MIPLASLFKQLVVKKKDEKPVVDILLSRLPVIVLSTGRSGKWIFSMEVKDAILSVVLLLAREYDLKALSNGKFEEIRD